MNADIFANLRFAAWRDALRVLAIQLVALVLVTVVTAIGWDIKGALSVLIGAGIGLLANAYLAIALLGKPLLQGRRGNVVLSWLIKIGLTVSLILIALKTKVTPLGLIVGLTAVSVAHWMAVSFWLRGRK